MFNCKFILESVTDPYGTFQRELKAGLRYTDDSSIPLSALDCGISLPGLGTESICQFLWAPLTESSLWRESLSLLDQLARRRWPWLADKKNVINYPELV